MPADPGWSSDSDGQKCERQAWLGLLEFIGPSPAGTPMWLPTDFGLAVLQLADQSDHDAITVLGLTVRPEDWLEAKRMAEALALRLGFSWSPPDRGPST